MILDFSRVTFTVNANLTSTRPSNSGNNSKQKSYAILLLWKFYLLFPSCAFLHLRRKTPNLQINCSPLFCAFPFFSFSCTQKYLFKTHRAINPTFREIIKRFNLSIFIREKLFRECLLIRKKSVSVNGWEFILRFSFAFR